MKNEKINTLQKEVNDIKKKYTILQNKAMELFNNKEYKKAIEQNEIVAELLKDEKNKIEEMHEIIMQEEHEKSMEKLMEELPEIQYKLKQNQNKITSNHKEQTIAYTIGDMKKILNKYNDDMPIIWRDGNTDETVKDYKETLNGLPNIAEIHNDNKAGHTVSVRTENNSNIYKMYINE